MGLQTELAANRRQSDARADDPMQLEPEWAVGEMDTDLNATLPPVPGLLEESADLSHTGAPSNEEWQHYNLVKALRAQGWRCPDGTYYPPNNAPFEWDCRLARAARKWSQRQAREGFEGHRYGGSTSCKRTEAEGYPSQRGCGENLALGGTTPQQALEQLKASNGHCKGMLEKSFNMVGVGYFQMAGAKYRHYWTDSFGSWHQRPDQGCIGGSPAPTPAPGCADIDTSNCQFYKSKGYCSSSANVKQQCRETCNIDGCGSQSASPAPSPSGGACADTDGACAYYRQNGYCSSSDNVKRACRRTCGLCSGGSPAPAPATCADTDGACAYYSQNGYCSSSDNVKKACRRTCGLCSGGSPAPAPATCADTDGACAYYRQ